MAPKTIVKKEPEKNGHSIVRSIYLYLVALIGLVVFVFGAVGILNNVLMNYVFHVSNYSYPFQPDSCLTGTPSANFKTPTPSSQEQSTVSAVSTKEIENCRALEKERIEQEQHNSIYRDFSISIAQIVIGLPLWLFHWLIIQKDYRKKKQQQNS